MNRLAMFYLIAGFVIQAFAQDPTVSDSDKYKTILENDRVRVLDYRDLPGDKTAQHHHPDFVLYAPSDFSRRLTFEDGTFKEREFKNGDVIFMNAQTHIGENIGVTNTHVIIVELKEPRPEDKANSHDGK